MNSKLINKAEKYEYALLNEIAQDSLVTQASLSNQLGIAVGSVNWYIKRLISRGWIKVSHLDRTRLKYDLTQKGMSVFTQRALLYARDSLKVYGEYRNKAKELVLNLQKDGIAKIRLCGEDEMMDILRLTCLEAGIQVVDAPNEQTIEVDGLNYKRT
ncbi:MAG: winged helix-turn-helix domain-containing protein [Anaerolineales bacterium]|nr:winged helix-turn-helix domain-containing protein [Anaerolineales bacterium]